MEFAGRVVVITGAGSGFGREFARIAAQRGMKLVLADVQRDALEATADEMRKLSAPVATEVVDVSKSEDVARLADRAWSEFGAVNLLFNNAGVGTGGYIWESSEADWAWVLGVNVMGVAHGIRHFVPRMLAAEKTGEPGHVVNTASMAGWVSPPLMGVYNVSKHAVVTMTETLYHDLRLAGSRIGTTLLSPAFVPTGIHTSERNRPEELANRQPPTESMEMARKLTEKAVTRGRIGAADVAQMTFDAIAANRFYVFTHPKILPTVHERVQAALAGEQPADPLAHRGEGARGANA